ncbi:adenine phosphoribosyltransferase [Microbacterium sediminicola]|uniref:Adenine phosphoribosyltransferase n=1 Tax=Microbacterium sediminicola TaxID=415210 RepID=A0ABN2IFF2_9MICO
MPATEPLIRAESLIRTIPDYPEPGILFRDITPMLADAAALRAVIDALIEPFAGQFDVVGGIEARGFLLAGAVATVADVGLIPIRKAGKLPLPAASVAYDLEYGSAAIEVHDDITPGMRVLLVDDVLATGGTIAAAKKLVAQLGGEVVGTAVLMELTALPGRNVAGEVHALFEA